MREYSRKFCIPDLMADMPIPDFKAAMMAEIPCILVDSCIILDLLLCLYDICHPLAVSLRQQLSLRQFSIT